MSNFDLHQLGVTRGRVAFVRLWNGAVLLCCAGPVRQGGQEMLVALSIGFMLAIWVVVIWGAIYFNQNVR
jgi:hypothetical protein